MRFAIASNILLSLILFAVAFVVWRGVAGLLELGKHDAPILAAAATPAPPAKSNLADKLTERDKLLFETGVLGGVAVYRAMAIIDTPIVTDVPCLQSNSWNALTNGFNNWASNWAIAWLKTNGK